MVNYTNIIWYNQDDRWEDVCDIPFTKSVNNGIHMDGIPLHTWAYMASKWNADPICFRQSTTRQLRAPRLCASSSCRRSGFPNHSCFQLPGDDFEDSRLSITVWKHVSVNIEINTSDILRSPVSRVSLVAEHELCPCIHQGRLRRSLRGIFQLLLPMGCSDTGERTWIAPKGRGISGN